MISIPGVDRRCLTQSGAAIPVFRDAMLLHAAVGGEVFRSTEVPMVSRSLSFTAEEVGAETVEHTRNFVVHRIFFGVGDPDADGHCWHFSRCFQDDWGVCTVREIQRAVLYEEIASFRLHRSGLECVFDAKGAAEAGFAELRIQFEIDDRAWNDLVAGARVVFRDRAYFTCAE